MNTSHNESNIKRLEIILVFIVALIGAAQAWWSSKLNSDTNLKVHALQQQIEDRDNLHSITDKIHKALPILIKDNETSEMTIPVLWRLAEKPEDKLTIALVALYSNKEKIKKATQETIVHHSENINEEELNLYLKLKTILLDESNLKNNEGGSNQHQANKHVDTDPETTDPAATKAIASITAADAKSRAESETKKPLAGFIYLGKINDKCEFQDDRTTTLKEMQKTGNDCPQLTSKQDITTKTYISSKPRQH